MRELTPLEQKLLQKTAEIAQAFYALNVIHPSDRDEFKFYLHGIQSLIHARPSIEKEFPHDA